MEKSAVIECSDENFSNLCREFASHVKECEKCEQREADRFRKLDAKIDMNTETLETLIKKNDKLFQAWDDAQAVIRVGSRLGRFAKWVGSLAIIGGAITWLIQTLGAPPGS